MRAELIRDASLRKRFLKEAKALAAINHPNVVQVFDDGEWNGRPFVVLQYVEGTTLREWLEGYGKIRKHPPVEEVRSLFAQVCEGVGAAHQKGIVHRDLKPENVLIEYDGEGRATAKVLDFGLARGGTLQTSTGVQGGTLQYMSPEQATEGADAVGVASDVFSLGVMLVEMLTRRLLPEHPRQTTWWNAAQMGRVPAALAGVASVRVDVPAGVWTAVGAALAVDPAGRPATAGALRQAVVAAWSGAPTGAVSNGGYAGASAAVESLPSVAAMQSMVMGAPPVIAPTEVMQRPREQSPVVTKGRLGLWPKLALGGVMVVALVGVAVKLSGSEPGAPLTPAPVIAAPATPIVAPTSAVPPPARNQTDAALAATPVPDVPGAPARQPTPPDVLAPVEDVPLVAPTAPPAPSGHRRHQGHTLPPEAAVAQPHGSTDGAPGRLSIGATPWCDVTVDGRGRGQTPVIGLSLPPGSHHIRCTNPEHAAQERTVTLGPGQDLRVRIHFP